MAITDPLDVLANGFLKVCKHRAGERGLHVRKTSIPYCERQDCMSKPTAYSIIISDVDIDPPDL